MAAGLLSPSTRFGLLALALSVAAGCERAVEERQLADDGWEVVREVDAGSAGLVEPRLLAATGDGVAVFDYATGRVTGFDARGGIVWVAGDRAALPNVVDMQGDGDGGVWLAEASRGRLFRVGEDGVLKAVPAPGDLAGVVPANDDARALLRGQGPLWARPRPDGTVETGAVPTRRLRRVEPHLRYPMGAYDPALDVWAVAFPFGDTYLVFERDVLRCLGHFPGWEGFPEEEERAVPRIRGAALAAGTLHLLAGENADQDIVDRFHAGECRYLDSSRLPAPGRAIAAEGDMLYLLTAEPSPRILLLWRPS